MNAGCSTLRPEVLSSYVDRELPKEELTEVEAHLEECHFCRGQLERVAGVANALRGLDRIAPPPILEELVLGRLEVRGTRTWSDRLDSMLTPSRRVRATIGPVFATVMMLVLLVFVFSDALVRRATQPIVISVPSGAWPPPSGLNPSAVTDSGRQFLTVTGAQWDELARERGASSVLVELNAAERAGLSQGPGAGAALVLIGGLPSCDPPTDAEFRDLRELAALNESEDQGILIVLVEPTGETGCRVLF